MSSTGGSRTTAIEIIKRQIKILNWSIVLVIYVLLFVIVRFLYLVLDYVPTTSMVAILAIAAVLVLVGTYMANSASRTAIRKIDEFNNKLNALLTTMHEIREIVHGDLLLDNIVDSSLKITGAEAGSILLSENDGLVFKVTKGLGSKGLKGRTVAKSDGVAGWVVERGTPVRVDDVEKDDRFSPEVDGITDDNVRSLLCVPLRSSSGTIGAIELVNKREGPFTTEDERLISYFADQAAAFIERARFYEDQRVFEIHLTDILLDALDKIIPEKHGHSKRVAKYALLMAHAMNMSEDGKRRLYRASLLHDIGFLKLPTQDVFSKEVYMEHPRIAYTMLQPINVYADVAPIILHHHERYDGRGYPSGLRGEEIPLESRMIAIAEAFDAIVSKDSYKYAAATGDYLPQSGYNHALKELEDNAGTQFDPELVALFLKNIDEDYLE